MINEIAANIWVVYLDTAFWLLLGLIAAGVVKAYIPADAMQRWLGGRGFPAVGRAALFGAPLPLCSCGVLPAALGLRRAGASKEATVSFLISTPETSIDSVAVTYALMGPVMAIYRPIAALVSALLTGLAVALVDRGDEGELTSPRAVTESACDNPASAQQRKQPVVYPALLLRLKAVADRQMLQIPPRSRPVCRRRCALPVPSCWMIFPAGWRWA